MCSIGLWHFRRPSVTFEGHSSTVVCAQLMRDLLVIAKFLIVAYLWGWHGDVTVECGLTCLKALCFALTYVVCCHRLWSPIICILSRVKWLGLYLLTVFQVRGISYQQMAHDVYVMLAQYTVRLESRPKFSGGNSETLILVHNCIVSLCHCCTDNKSRLGRNKHVCGCMEWHHTASAARGYISWCSTDKQSVGSYLWQTAISEQIVHLSPGAGGVGDRWRHCSSSMMKSLCFFTTTVASCDLLNFICVVIQISCSV